MIRIVMRAAMLLGLPVGNVESVYVTRYRAGEYYKAHHDAYEGFDGDRYYTTLIYLNDMEESEGGGTVFEKLNIGVRPKCGRAVIWTNRNPDGSTHAETTHEALPVNEGTEKWVIQLWFRSYKMIDIPANELDSGNAATITALREAKNCLGALGLWKTMLTVTLITTAGQAENYEAISWKTEKACRATALPAQLLPCENRSPERSGNATALLPQRVHGASHRQYRDRSRR